MLCSKVASYIALALVLVLMFSIVSMGANGAGHEASAAWTTTHSHDGEPVHTHTDSSYKNELATVFCCNLNENQTFLASHYIFFIPPSPISSLERPPEQILLQM